MNIRALIEERAILLVKLPVNEEAYIHSAPVVGTLLMAMIYAAIFSFADIHLAARPGCTLVVDEFQNFATDEYAKLFEQGRKYKVKQFLAHQHRQQFQREDTSSTNLAATTSANTIIAFRTILKDSTELASLFLPIARNRRPSNIYLYPLEKVFQHPNPTIKAFTRAVVDTLDKAAGGKIKKVKVEYPFRDFTITRSPQVDFGAGEVEVVPSEAADALTLLERLIYDSETAGYIVKEQRDAFLQAVAKFWKFDNYLGGQYDNREELERYRTFSHQLSTTLTILIREPIAQDATLTPADIAKLLEQQQKRHALMKTGSQAFQMHTNDTQLFHVAVSEIEAEQRYTQVLERTRQRYCIPRSELDEMKQEHAVTRPVETESESAIRDERDTPPQEKQTVAPSEPAVIAVPQPQIQAPQPPPPEPEKQLVASRDTSNSLYAQMKAKAIDPETAILASLGEYYVMTIKQWMRLFAWKTYPKATVYFKQLREQGYIFRKDREGRGGQLVEGDWFFLLTKGANELVKRRQTEPFFKFEPNEAEKASGDTLLHTYLVNEILIQLRLLARTQPETVTIEQIVHERSMRRAYHSLLGVDAKFYPDGFLRLLVPTVNGLKRRSLFLELQHTTQKDKANWQAKVQKYMQLFERIDMLEKFFHTRSPQVLVITMDEEHATYHKHWTEEVLKQAGEQGRNSSNRFVIGAYDTGMSAQVVSPVQFFCTPRFYQPFRDAAYPVFTLSTEQRV